MTAEHDPEMLRVARFSAALHERLKSRTYGHAFDIDPRVVVNAVQAVIDDDGWLIVPPEAEVRMVPPPSLPWWRVALRWGLVRR